MKLELLDRKVVVPKRDNGVVSTFKSVAVIGAAGQTGELYARSLSKVAHVEAVVRERRWKDEAGQTGIGFHTDIKAMLATCPDVVILATPNPVERVLKEIAQHAQRPTTLVLSQNGVISDEAKKILADCADQITPVRASLFTNVSRDEEGNIAYNLKKNRLALASMGENPVNSLLTDMFIQAGFDARIRPDYRSMEYTKLLINLIGTTSTITGLPPLQTFSDRKIFAIEQKGIKDRFKIYEAEGIGIDDGLWSVKGLKLLAGIPGFLVGRGPWGVILRRFIAKKIASERNNQPSAAARKIKEGARSVESDDYFHQPIVNLGQKHHIESPMDEAIRDILARHQRINNHFNLASFDTHTRARLFLEIYGLEAKEIFIKSSLPHRVIVNGLYSLGRRHLEIKGAGSLKPVTETLMRGESALVAPNHRGNGDHPVEMEGFEEGTSC